MNHDLTEPHNLERSVSKIKTNKHTKTTEWSFCENDEASQEFV